MTFSLPPPPFPTRVDAPDEQEHEPAALPVHKYEIWPDSPAMPSNAGSQAFTIVQTDSETLIASLGTLILPNELCFSVFTNALLSEERLRQLKFSSQTSSDTSTLHDSGHVLMPAEDEEEDELDHPTEAPFNEGQYLLKHAAPIARRSPRRLVVDLGEPDDSLEDPSQHDDPPELHSPTLPDEKRRSVSEGQNAQRIQFSDVVRISGGIGSSKSKIRGRQLAIAHSPPYSPSPNRSVTTTTTSPVPNRSPQPSRSPSLPPAHSRSNSVSSVLYHPSPLNPNATLPHYLSSRTSSAATSIHHGFANSLPMSTGASRSSSPCSSIFAPLQLPAETAPSPSRTLAYYQKMQANASRFGSDDEVAGKYKALLRAQDAERRRRRRAAMEAAGTPITPRVKRRPKPRGCLGAFRRLWLGAEGDERRSLLRDAEEYDSDEEEEEEDEDEDFKTEAEVRFGKQPGRWRKRAWWRWKLSNLFVLLCMGQQHQEDMV